MGRPLRLFEPDGIYFVTGRCLQARLLMRPSERVNDIVGGVLAQAVHHLEVEVFAFVFLSNHFHMLIRSRENRIPAFMQFLRSNIARKVGYLVDWRGKFWDRRYDSEPVLDDDALIGRLRYILAHGVKEGLIDQCADWPGLTCLPELAHGRMRQFSWTGRSSLEGCELSLAVLPCWEAMSSERRCRTVRQLVLDVEAEAHVSRRGTPVMGVRRILRQDPHDRPRRPRREPRPVCHATTQAAHNAYVAKYRAFAEAYRVASEAYRAGTVDVEFPLYAYRPPWVVPRLLAA